MEIVFEKFKGRYGGIFKKAENMKQRFTDFLFHFLQIQILVHNFEKFGEFFIQLYNFDLQIFTSLFNTNSSTHFKA